MVHALRSKDEEALPSQGKTSISQIIPNPELDLENKQLKQNKTVQ